MKVGAALTQAQGTPAPTAPAAPTTIAAGPDGPKITVGTDGKMTIVAPDGSTTIVGPDGRVLTHVSADGEVSQPSIDPPTIIHQGMEEGAVVSILTISVLAAYFIGRWRGRRSTRSQVRDAAAQLGALPSDLGERIDRIEHAVESVAIEVERISEGQRFTTKLMSEMRQPAAVAQLASAQPEAAPVRREPAAAVPASERRS
jgi:hypothetical protein